MKDRIEEFISEHKDELDMHQPPDRIWQAIQKQLPAKTPRRQARYWAFAASVVFITVSFVWFTGPSPKQAAVLRETDAAVITDTSINEAETYYTNVATEKREVLDQYKAAYPELYNDFTDEIDTLNFSYSALKTEYANSAGKEVIKQAMIENLQTQVQLMDRQIEIISNIKERTNKTSNS